MNKRNKIIAFLVAALLSYGGLYALVGPEKVRAWHQERQHHHHGHHCDHDSHNEPVDESL